MLVILAAVLAGIIAGVSLTHFSDDATLKRITKAGALGSVNRVQREAKLYQLWADYPGRLMTRMGRKFDRVRVSATALVYQGRAAEAYALATQNQRDELKLWAFEQLKASIEAAQTADTRQQLIMSAQQVLSPEHQEELRALLSKPAAR